MTEVVIGSIRNNGTDLPREAIGLTGTEPLENRGNSLRHSMNVVNR